MPRERRPRLVAEVRLSRRPKAAAVRTTNARSGTVAAYDGQRALGTVQRRSGRYLAITTNNKILGLFASQSTAADALQRWSERP